MITLAIAGHAIDGYEAGAALLLALAAVGVLLALRHGFKEALEERQRHTLDVSLTRPYGMNTRCPYAVPAPSAAQGMLVCKLEDHHLERHQLASASVAILGRAS